MYFPSVQNYSLGLPEMNKAVKNEFDVQFIKIIASVYSKNAFA